ncbi:hypothetical protein [Photorhabdus cinerea]|uniref:Uncharacterized protein n=1 Tax=Photorhabdus cinerea TaxID=471575 RepID=A0A7X5QHI0_9GAMM|nr:hypothetical protein [Photorhabdus cinerea]NHB94478.1 hypothetical protein [Photorhabdus cinerea]
MSDNKRHVHADSMLEYAIDASKTDKPWELWEQLCSDETGGSNRLIPVEVTSTDGVIASELDPIGDVQELKKELAALGMTTNEAIEILRKSRLSKQDQRRAGRQAC